MLKRGYLENAIEKSKPNMQLINVIPLIRKVFLFLFQKLFHVVNQRIDKTNNQDEVNDVALCVRAIQLLNVFGGNNAADAFFVKTGGVVVLLQEELNIEIESQQINRMNSSSDIMKLPSVLIPFELYEISQNLALKYL